MNHIKGDPVKQAVQEVVNFFKSLDFLNRRRVVKADEDHKKQASRVLREVDLENVASQRIHSGTFFASDKQMTNINFPRAASVQYTRNKVVIAGPHLATKVAKELLAAVTSHEVDTMAQGVDAHGNLIR